MTPEDGIRFLRQFQELLAEGGFVATYKFALLQSLADLSVENQPGSDGALHLHVEQIAEKFIEYYWHQARPFYDEVLRQNTKGQAEVVSLVHEYRMVSDGKLSQLRGDKEEWNRLRRRIAQIVVKMPLWRLQRIGNRDNEFLYRRAEYEDRQIRLLPGIPEAFRAFHPLLTNMVRGRWIAHIQNIRGNHHILGPAAELEGFLFGTDRDSLESYRELFLDYQDKVCFYCRRTVSNKGELDHFIPWARYPDNLGHNFVFAHKKCNNSKRDHLAAPIHIERWRVQNLDNGDKLARLFNEAGLVHDVERSYRIACWAYEQGQASGARLWVEDREFEECDDRWKRALSVAQ